MIDFTNTEIEQMIVHKVGNKHREEKNVISNELTEVDADLKELLLKYFGKSFKDVAETYHFVHDIDISYNVLNGLIMKMFDNPDDFIDLSKDVLNHLFEQSNHPHIKSGDLFICDFTNIVYDDEIVSVIGIFKSESKDAFLKLSEESDVIKIYKDDGIGLKKLDKACIIINKEKEDGFRVLSIDNNRYDTEYWKEHFLKIDFVHDNNFTTKNYLQLCKSFSEEIVAESLGKKGQVDFINQTVKFLDDTEVLDIDEFADTLFGDDETKSTFKEFKNEYEEANDITFDSSFEISEIVYKKEKRKFKNIIKLDTNIQLKLDFNNPESMERFVEKGYDDEKEMYYYKVYFNEEK